MVCSEMWKAKLRVVAEVAKAALHMLDHFHIVQKLSEVINDVRAAEAKELKAHGKESVLKNSRRLLLERFEHLIDKQEPKLAAMVKLKL